MSDPLNNMGDAPYFTGEGLMGTGGALSWNDTTDLFWRNAFALRRGLPADASYDQYQGAYRYGFEAAQQMRGRSFEESEDHLRGQWGDYPHRGGASERWESVRDAVHEAWKHVREHIGK